MWKKILAGAFIAVMVGAIAIGVIELTSGDALAHVRGSTNQQSVAAEQGQRRGQARAEAQVAEPVGGQGLGQGAQGNGTRGAATASGQGLGQGAQGNGARGAATLSEQGLGQGAQGNGTRGAATLSEQGLGQGAQGNGTRGAATASGQGLGQGAQGNGTRGGQGLNGEPAATIETLETIQGTVLETTELVIETETGTVQVGLGPSQFREERGFVLRVGDQVAVTGFWEDGEFKATTVVNLDLDTEIVLRDSSGHPMWSGQGRRSGV
ncbi:MAG: hypothetical protein JXA09_08065 [Anaerolineae bacterium]|nr:hypothetical protein [Anaerolineae bacterium]